MQVTEEINKTGTSEDSISAVDEERKVQAKDGEKTEEKGFVWGDGLSLSVSASQMQASIEVDLEYADRYKVDDLERFLKQNKISSTIINEELHRIFEKKLFNENVLAAKGIKAKHGENGRVEWEVDLSILEGAKLIEKGSRVDWKDQHHIISVEEGDLLARLIDPTDGANGVNVYDSEIPANSGKPAKLPVGKGVRLSEDEKELHAEISGVIYKEGDKISVSPVYNVEGNVDLSTGNVAFNETVTITGDVLTDFKVQAGQDLHVNGLVEGAELTACGNIYINGGIQGDSKARITAGGEIVVKFINNAHVEAQGDITVNGSITQSTVKSKESIRVESVKAVIVGGHVCAEKEVSTSVIGSEIGVKTIVEIGADLCAQLDLKREEEEKKNALVMNFKKLKQATDQFNKLRDKGKLNPQQETMRLKVVRNALLLQGQIRKIQGKIISIVDQIEMARKAQTGVVAKEIVWPGTIIRIMGESFPVKTQISKAVFAMVEEEINVFAYKKREEKKSDKKKKEKEE